MDVSIIIPAANCSHSIEKTVRALRDYLKKLGVTFEILLVPNGIPSDETQLTQKACERLAGEFTEVKLYELLGPPGKGRAIASAVEKTSGKNLYYTDADSPFDLSFIGEAEKLLKGSTGLVVGNRRLPESRFIVPPGLMGLAYRRHKLGVLFNAAVRFLFGFSVTDSQAGLKGMKRELALMAFPKMVCDGFLFDIELLLVAKRTGFETRELPLTFRLSTEKSTVRIFRECFLSLYWFWRIKLRDLKGGYVGRMDR